MKNWTRGPKHYVYRHGRPVGGTHVTYRVRRVPDEKVIVVLLKLLLFLIERFFTFQVELKPLAAKVRNRTSLLYRESWPKISPVRPD